ncbi:MAG: tRNA pseudouridine(38-40) synthase TruA [Desulfobacterales bacterium]|nr:tRNA pseudouridine(38-40) synthase TruA [Desulfobacterales bacterium]
MNKKFKIIVEYDGSAYHGWQRQKTDPSVQEAIETALATITGTRLTLTGSGRTDAGVHALGQAAHFSCDTRMKAGELHKGLNSLLPEDIVIRDCRQVPESFHARFDVRRKTYQYRILNRPLPAAIGRQYLWQIRRPLDADAMSRGLAYIVGTHDFKAFEGTGSPRAHTEREIFRAEIEKEPEGVLAINIEGNGFLRFMVRNIVGTLVDVGTGKRMPEDIQRILASKDRSRAGATAPPQGLFLVRVDYE